jgi:hypothetical protein
MNLDKNLCIKALVESLITVSRYKGTPREFVAEICKIMDMPSNVEQNLVNILNQLKKLYLDVAGNIQRQEFIFFKY